MLEPKLFITNARNQATSNQSVLRKRRIKTNKDVYLGLGRMSINMENLDELESKIEETKEVENLSYVQYII